MIRFLIWDVGGTLFDTYPAVVRAFDRALRELGAAASPDRIGTLARQSLRHCTDVLARELGLDREELDRRFRRTYASIPPAEQPPLPGVVEVCAYICSIGGGNFIFTHRGRASALALLDAHGLTGYFADLLTVEDGYPRKPDPAGFRAIVERHGLDRAEVLAVGDRDIDVQAGKAAGVRTCRLGVDPFGMPADYAVSDLAELGRLLVSENEGLAS